MFLTPDTFLLLDIQGGGLYVLNSPVPNGSWVSTHTDAVVVTSDQISSASQDFSFNISGQAGSFNICFTATYVNEDDSGGDVSGTISDICITPV